MEAKGGQVAATGHVIPVVTTFPLISQFQESSQGSLCNQAIMIITDGAVEDYEPVFETYNWPDRKVTDSCWKSGERGPLPMPRETSKSC